MKKLDRSTNKLFRYRDIRMVVDWKNKYANINMDNVGELEKLLRKRKRALIKLFLRLRFSKLPDARQELHIVEKVLQEVCFSRNTNQVRGKHYLEWYFSIVIFSSDRLKIPEEFFLQKSSPITLCFSLISFGPSFTFVRTLFAKWVFSRRICEQSPNNSRTKGGQN